MSSDSPDAKQFEHQLRHQSRLLEWEKRFDYATHSDRLAGEIGIFVIKTMLLINGGGSIALIGAFAGLSRHATVGSELAAGGGYFLWGLTSAVVGAVVSYFYQSVNTENEWCRMRQAFGEISGRKWTERTRVVLISIAIVFLLISFGLFVAGAQHVLGAFNTTTQINAGWML